MSYPDYGALVAELRSLPEGDGSRVVLVVGAVHGEGVTTVARGLAAALVLHDEARVFVVDAGSQVNHRRRGAGLGAGSESNGETGAEGSPTKKGRSGRKATRKKGGEQKREPDSMGEREVLYHPMEIGDGGAYGGVVPLPAITTPGGRIDFLYKKKLEGAFAEFKNEFEWIIIDAQPVTVYPEFAVLASVADVTLLVVKAESTRWEVAEKAKHIIERAGGNLLGVVLSHRQYHIPDVVYRRL